jgi:hypothetical protein
LRVVERIVVRVVLRRRLRRVRELSVPAAPRDRFGLG